MQLCKVKRSNGAAAVSVLEAGQVRLLEGAPTLSSILYSEDPASAARSLLKPKKSGCSS